MIKATSFDAILDMIEALSLEEQDALLDIVCRRQAERRRREIAKNIAQAKAEYQAGEVSRGTVYEIITELNK
ncbi:MAG: hypothetical protein F6K14_27325 [Symploca sp. SIO2C1]|nr:hypothetical protein [Symploca sp. SIO2C1]